MCNYIQKIRDNLKSQISFNIVDNPNKPTKKKDNNFVPHYANEDPYARHLKEFNKSNIITHQAKNSLPENIGKNSVGCFTSTLESSNNHFDRKDFVNLSHKEKRLVEFSTNLSTEEIQKRMREVENLKKAQIKNKEKEEKFKKGENAKETYYKQTHSSNIFGENKTKNYTVTQKKIEKENKVKVEEDNKIKGKPHDKNITGWVNNLDWKQIDSSIHFHKKDG